MTYDWLKLKRQFIYNKKYATTSLRKFAEINGIPYAGQFLEKTKGWRKEKEAKRKEIGSKIEAKLSAAIVNDAVEANAAHNEFWCIVFSQLRAAIEQTNIYIDMFGKERKMKSIIPSKLKSLAQVAEMAQKGQRLALDMDKSKDKTNMEERLISVLDSMREAFTDEPGEG